MVVTPSGFRQQIYVARPMLPELDLYMAQLKDVWDTHRLTNGGEKHVELEKALSRVFETENLSLFNNGTIALVTACQSLRLSGEVITTPFTFPATPHVLVWNGITPVFADIDPVTLTLDPTRIEPMITGRTSAILGVHVYGIPCDVDGIQKVADRHGLRVIYDAAHAFGTRVNGKLITDFGDISMLSFHATKLFHTAEGGALICKDSLVKTRVDLLRNFGIQDETTILMPGINGKMSELQAALGLLTLEMVDRERAARRDIMAIYEARLSPIPGITLPVSANSDGNSYQYFPIRLNSKQSGKTRDELHERLKDFNIFTRKYFFPLCSEYPTYRMLPSANSSYLPVAHRVASEVLVLPFYGSLSIDDVYRICDIIEFVLQSA